MYNYWVVIKGRLDVKIFERWDCGMMASYPYEIGAINRIRSNNSQWQICKLEGLIRKSVYE